MKTRGLFPAAVACLLLLVAARASAVDTGGLRLYALTEHLTVYAGDAADYSGMVAALEAQYRRLVAKYDLAFDRRVGVYVCPDQLTFVRKVFGWTTVESNVAGLADPGQRRLFLTSIYRSDADTTLVYNLSGWLVKFIVEGLLAGDAPRFVRFARSPTDWSAIGVTGERDLMGRWKAWMEARPAAAPQG